MKKGCLISGLGVIITLCALIVIGSMTTTPPSQTERQPIEIVKSAWTISDSGKALHAITVKNTGQDKRHDLMLQIIYSAKTGTTVATHDKIVYEFLEPGKTMTVTVEDYAPKEAMTARIHILGSAQ